MREHGRRASRFLTRAESHRLEAARPGDEQDAVLLTHAVGQRDGTGGQQRAERRPIHRPHGVHTRLRSAAGRPNVTLDEELCAFAVYLSSRHNSLIIRTIAEWRAATEAADAADAAALARLLALANSTNATAAEAAQALLNATSGANASALNSSAPTLVLPPTFKHFSARPKLIVRGKDGEPLAGRASPASVSVTKVTE